jgi:ATP-dependent RNA helicase DeaD
MADTFEQLGIAPELAGRAAAAGWVSPSGLQQAALPVIRRANNVILHASAGAGVTGAYALGVLDRLLAADDGLEAPPRALILVPSADDASRTADAVATLAAGTSVRVAALAQGWPARPADLVVASPAAAVDGIRDSSLKIGGLVALVIDGADQMADTAQWDALETVLEATPTTAQRVLVAGRLDEAMDGLVERHVRKAMTIPPRTTEVAEPPVEPTATVRYVVAAEREKTAALTTLLAGVDAPDVSVICRNAGRADRLSADLAARGIPVQTGGDKEGARRILVLPLHEADRRSTRAQVISYDAPFDAETLTELHGRGGTVLVTPRQLAHLTRIARRAGTTLEPVPTPSPGQTEIVEAIRARLRETARATDLAADLALIEPLLEEFTAPELAAAALHMARSAAGARAGASLAAGADVASAEAARARSAPTAPPPSTAWVRLFVSAGTRDGLGPGDLVGAITGETGLAGDEVGKIEVRESHSTVEVPGSAAESVIQALNGRSLRGRSLRVDYDRKERSQRRPASGGPPGRGGPRPGSRGPGPGGPRPGGTRPGGPKPGGRGGPPRGRRG